MKVLVISSKIQSLKPKLTSFPITGTLRMGIVIKKPSILLQDIEVYNIHIDEIQIKLERDDLAFPGPLNEFCDPIFRN